MNRIRISCLGEIGASTLDHHELNILDIEKTTIPLPIGGGRIDQGIMNDIVHMSIGVIILPTGL
jgi:hypothetical protein